jgi:prevent-host-death family protein
MRLSLLQNEVKIMQIVGSYEAKTKLAELLRMVEENDEEIIITRRGQPIARITPERHVTDIGAAICALKLATKKILKAKQKQPIKDLINEGRKY